MNMYRCRIDISVQPPDGNEACSYVKFLDLPFVPTEGMTLSLDGMSGETLTIHSVIFNESGNLDKRWYFDVDIMEEDGTGGFAPWEVNYAEIQGLEEDGYRREP